MDKYAKFINKNKIELAPALLVLGPKKYIANPLPKHYIAAGYLELIEEKPECEAGFTLENKHWQKKNGKIYAVWDKVKIPTEEVEGGENDMESEG